MSSTRRSSAKPTRYEMPFPASTVAVRSLIVSVWPSRLDGGQHSGLR